MSSGTNPLGDADDGQLGGRQPEKDDVDCVTTCLEPGKPSGERLARERRLEQAPMWPFSVLRSHNEPPPTPVAIWIGEHCQHPTTVLVVRMAGTINPVVEAPISCAKHTNDRRSLY